MTARILTERSLRERDADELNLVSWPDSLDMQADAKESITALIERVKCVLGEGEGGGDVWAAVRGGWTRLEESTGRLVHDYADKIGAGEKGGKELRIFVSDTKSSGDGVLLFLRLLATLLPTPDIILDYNRRG